MGIEITITPHPNYWHEPSLFDSVELIDYPFEQHEFSSINDYNEIKSYWDQQIYPLILSHTYSRCKILRQYDGPFNILSFNNMKIYDIIISLENTIKFFKKIIKYGDKYSDLYSYLQNKITLDDMKFLMQNMDTFLQHIKTYNGEWYFIYD